MRNVRVRILGTLKVSGDDVGEPRLSRSVRRLIALIAAAGPDGIDRDAMANELWGDPLPESWKSALRNRMTSARRVLGADQILNTAGRVCFSESVQVDSWDLIRHDLSHWRDDPNELRFLEGDPLLGIAPSPLLRTHATHIADARAALLLAVANARTDGFSPLALQTLRSYQRRNPLHATVTRQTVQAHCAAGETGDAAMIIAEVKALTADSDDTTKRWVDELSHLLDDAGTGQLANERNTANSESEEADVRVRAELFASAARDEDWSVALEIAMSGLPAAERMYGDPARLALLDAIPLDKLDPARKFSYSLTMARHTMYAGREAEAREWSATTRALATSPDEQLLAYITGAIVGDSPDERTPIPLPDAFDAASDETVNMQSLQVAVMSHLERASFDEAEPLRQRFNSLVEASADPYRRWHMLMLESMAQLVDGEIEAANQLAHRAYKYADLFGIVDAELALVGQLSNAAWIHRGFTDIEDGAQQYPDSAHSNLSLALRAAALAPHDGGEAANEFMRSFDWRSRSFFTMPTTMIVATSVTDPDLRAELAEHMKRRTGTSVIWGTGVLHLGPVDRCMAHLVDDPIEKELHLAAAVRVADRQRFRIWQVVTRLDLAAVSGNEQHRQEAESFATTTALEQLVANYQPIIASS